MTASFSTQRPSTTRFPWLPPLLLALPVVCFVLFVLVYAVNVPWLDDIDAFLGFTLAYLDAPTLAGKMHNILVPNNEHRIVSAKLITLAMYYLTGEVNFRWLILIALLFSLATFGLFFRVFRSMRQPVLAFAPVAFLFFQPEYHLTTLWSVTGLQHPVVICLTLFALYLLSRTGQADRAYSRVAGAAALQMLATLSMSNGLMGWLGGGIMLALNRQWRGLGIWAAGCGLTLWVYFHDFQSGTRTGEGLGYFLEHPVVTINAFFTFTGGMFDLTPTASGYVRYILPTLGGAVLTVLVAALVYRAVQPLLTSRWQQTNTGLRQRRLFFMGSYAFLFANAGIIAVLRLRYGYDVMVVTNYMIYPATLAALLYLNLLSEFSNYVARQRLLRVGLVVGVGVWVFAYSVYWPRMAYRKQLLLTNAMNQKHTGIGLGPSWGTPFADMARQVMQESVRRGVYHYPTSYLSALEPLIWSPTGVASQAVATSDSCLTMPITGGGYSYLTATKPNAFPDGIGPAAVLVSSAKQTFLFPSETPYSLGNFWLSQRVTAINAEIIIPILQPGRYRVGVLTPSTPTRPIRFGCEPITI